MKPKSRFLRTRAYLTPMLDRAIRRLHETSGQSYAAELRTLLDLGIRARARELGVKGVMVDEIG